MSTICHLIHYYARDSRVFALYRLVLFGSRRLFFRVLREGYGGSPRVHGEDSLVAEASGSHRITLHVLWSFYLDSIFCLAFCAPSLVCHKPRILSYLSIS